MNRFIVDTNMLIRTLVDDNDPQRQTILSILTRVSSGEIILTVPNEVVVEAVWVMKSYYKLPRASIARAIGRFLGSDGIEASREIRAAIGLLETVNADIVDLLLSTYATHTSTAVLTWDQDFLKLNCESYTPDQIHN